MGVEEEVVEERDKGEAEGQGREGRQEREVEHNERNFSGSSEGEGTKEGQRLELVGETGVEETGGGEGEGEVEGGVVGGVWEQEEER